MVSVISGKRQLENGDCSLVTCSPKYKRRRVSALRDFPPRCGPKAAEMKLETAEVEGGEQTGDVPSKVEFGGDRGRDTNDVERKEILGNIANHICSSSFDKETSTLVKPINVEQGIQESPKLMTDNGSDDLLKEMIVEDSKLSQHSVRTEEHTKKPETHGMSELMGNKVKSPISLKNTDITDMKEARNGIQSEHVVEESELLHYPIPSHLVWKERKYPPRRRVSVSRAFPPRCGRDVQQFSEAENEHLGKNLIDANPRKDLVTEPQVDGALEANDDIANIKTEGVVYEKTEDNLEDKSLGHNIVDANEIVQDSELGLFSMIKCQTDMFESTDGERYGSVPEKEEYHGKDKEDIEDPVEIDNKEVIVYVKDKQKKKSVGHNSNDTGLLEKIEAGAQNLENMVLVQGLSVVPDSPERGRPIISSPSTYSVKESKKKNKSDHAGQHQHKCSSGITAGNTKDPKKRSTIKKPSLKKTETKEILSVRDEGNSSESEEMPQDFLFSRRPVDVTICSQDAGSPDEKGVRSKVREILRLFQAVVRKLLQGEETKTKDDSKLNDQDNASKRIDLRAAKILKSHGKCVNTGKKSLLGPIPGVEVGDFFHYRMELSIIGLHRPPQGGIDYLKQGDKIIATSIVASGGYANDVDSSEVLIYTGQGGNAKGGDKQAEDQKLERGNLALKNSIDVKNPVRVIRGSKETKPSETANSKPKMVSTYTYDGLYTVEKYWCDLGPHQKMVYKFELRRLPGQPELAWKEVKKSKKFKVREGRCVDDISGGKEVFPICAVNTIDDEKPPAFTYITRMRYPDWYQPVPPRGCDCKNGCSDSEHCACAVKNGGEIPYNHDGAIVEVKPLVYECGPSCKCPQTCHNRVSQCGIKFPLEIFKTESRGWGVRSLSSIPSGSFICEYLGELLDDKEAEQRAGGDEYLFDIGRNFDDPTLRDGLSTLLPDLSSSSGDVVENIGFTIDAAKYGNIGRFINHSCSPNLYAQNVLYDHSDKRIPHVMLFAAENIPPLQELTYHYNYTLDQVFDSDGNIKKKSCHCGSSECTGRMY